MSEAEVPLETLLSHRAWVRRVARALVATEADADDLEQEVWLRALKNRPRAEGAVRGWLRTVLRNAAFDLRRSGARRRNHEEDVPPRGPEVPTADLVAEADQHRRVVDAVMELEEPYRATILLHYFHGLTAAAIAGREGIPLETVRTRLRRAREQLRERFDRERGGDRKAWVLALLPLAEDGGPEVPVAGTPAGISLLGAAAAVLALLGAGAWLLASGRQSPPPATGDGVSGTVAAAHPAETRTAPPPSSGPEAGARGADPALPAATTGNLHGRTVDHATGRGVPGIVLTLLSHAVPRGRAFLAISPAEGRYEARSGEDGRYAFPDLPSGLYRLEVRPPSWVDVDLDGIRVEQGALNLDVPLLPGVSVAGRVLDAGTGFPLAEGVVTMHYGAGGLSPKSAPVGPDGTFVLRGLPDYATSGVSSFCSVFAEGYDPSPQQMSVAPAFDMEGIQTREAVLRVPRGAVRTGRVLGPFGRPVAAARVLLGDRFLLKAVHVGDRSLYDSTGRRPAEGRTDVEGRFRILLPAHRPQERLLVLHPAWAPHFGMLAPGSQGDPIEVRLSEGASLNLTVTGSPKPSEARAEVRLVLLDPDPSPGFSVEGDILGAMSGLQRTDAEGRVSLKGLCPGEWRVEVQSADGHRWGSVTAGIREGEDASATVALEPAPMIQGTVVDQDGQGMPGTVVGLSQPDLLDRFTRTDEEGRFGFPCVVTTGPGTPPRVYIGSLPEGVVGWMSDPVPGGADPKAPVRLRVRVFEEARTVSGTVVDAETGAVVPMGSANVKAPVPGQPGTTTDNTFRYLNGSFTFTVVGPGSARFKFWGAPGYEDRLVTEEELQRAAYEVRLYPRRVSGHVRLRIRITGGEDPTGNRAYAWVRLFDRDSKRPCTRSNGAEFWTAGELPEIVMDEGELPPSGTVLVCVQVPGWYQAAPAEGLLEPGKEATVSVDLRRGGGLLKGKVIGAAGGKVFLKGPDGVERSLWVIEDGTYGSGTIAPGTWTLRAEGGPPVVVSVADGETVETELPR